MDGEPDVTMPDEAPPVMRWTVLGRAADADGAGLEVKWTNMDFENAVKLVGEAPDLLREHFTKTFGREAPQCVEVVRLPYVEVMDGEGEGEADL